MEVRKGAAQVSTRRGAQVDILCQSQCHGASIALSKKASTSSARQVFERDSQVFILVQKQVTIVAFLSRVAIDQSSFRVTDEKIESIGIPVSGLDESMITIRKVLHQRPSFGNCRCYSFRRYQLGPRPHLLLRYHPQGLS